MKLKIILLSSLFFFILSFVADDLSRFGTNGEEFRENLTRMASYKEFSGFKSYYSAEIKKACMSIPAEQQAAAAKTIAGLVKKYVMSPSFTADYKAKLISEIKNTDRNAAEWKDKYTAEYQEGLNSAESMSAAGLFNDDFFTSLQGAADMFKQQAELPNAYGDSPEGVKAYQDMKQMLTNEVDFYGKVLKLRPLVKSNPKEFIKQWAALSAERKIQQDLLSERQANDEILKNAEENKDFKKNIKAQLEQFLEETTDVDFNAKVVKNQYGQTIFQNPEYEQKPSTWKQSYRIGKPAMTAFRSFAEEWSKELQ